jgi:mitochondrial translocator assembly and maintenance protein 41
MLTRSTINRLLSKFPQGSFCFAYGSKVFPQIGYDNHQDSDEKLNKSNALAHDAKQKTKPLMIDLLFTVENPFQWHEQNLQLNPSHYSSMRLLGSRFIARYQQTYGAKVYCNTLVPLENDNNLMVKYGVITTKDLIVDLYDWKDLYVAGRLHKPVKIIRDPINSKIQSALDMNLQSALRASLLLLPKEFTELELYHTIAQLSYNGDFRMIFGENKNKVHNIVKPQVHNFRWLYRPTIELFRNVLDYPDSTSELADVLCRQDKSPAVILQHLNLLPKWPIRRIVREWNRGRYRMDTEDVLRAVACSPKYQEIVRKSLADIVWQSSVKQSIKNIPTGGFKKSLEYAWSKAIKTFNL